MSCIDPFIVAYPQVQLPQPIITISFSSIGPQKIEHPFHRRIERRRAVEAWIAYLQYKISHAPEPSPFPRMSTGEIEATQKLLEQLKQTRIKKQALTVTTENPLMPETLIVEPEEPTELDIAEERLIALITKYLEKAKN